MTYRPKNKFGVCCVIDYVLWTALFIFMLPVIILLLRGVPWLARGWWELTTAVFTGGPLP